VARGPSSREHFKNYWKASFAFSSANIFGRYNERSVYNVYDCGQLNGAFDNSVQRIYILSIMSTLMHDYEIVEAREIAIIRSFEK
jgi:hypothetical protein